MALLHDHDVLLRHVITPLSLTLAGLLVYNATQGSGSTYGKLLAFFALISIVAFCVGFARHAPPQTA